MSATDLYDEWKQHVSTSMQILEMQCIGRLQVPGPSSGIWQVGIVLETFEDEEKQFRAVKFVSRAAELFYFIF